MTDFSKYTALLKSAIGIIVFLFGAFNNFLQDIAPPNPSDEFNLPVGIAKFTSLALLLFVSLLCNFKALNQKQTQKKFVSLWLWIAGLLILIFLAGSLFYSNNFREKTVWHQDWKVRLLKGNELTDESKEICVEENKYANVSACEQFLLYKYYNAKQINDEHLLWTEQSVQANLRLLVYAYIVVVVSLSALLFSLVELLSWNLFRKKGDATPDKQLKTNAGSPARRREN